MKALIVPGHGLLSEGAAFNEDKTRVRWNTVAGVGRGMCSCGGMSEALPNAAARKRWHREHKAAVAGAN